MTYPFQSLPENLAAFCAGLRRDHRFRIGPRELQDAARALELADLSDERAVRDVLRPVLARSRDESHAFDDAFERFFRRSQAVRFETAGLPEAAEREPEARAANSRQATHASTGSTDEEDVREETGGHPRIEDVSEAQADSKLAVLRASYSPLESEGPVPDLVPVDRAWRQAAWLLLNRVRTGLSRRWRPALRGARFDLRRTLRTSLHTGGEVLLPRWRARPRRRPRFVILIDGSRSMGAHAVAALRIAVAIASVTQNVEAFTFSTALRRITRDVRRAAAGERRPLHLERAWGGGTAIGGSFREFVRRFGERLLGRDTVVIVASDGFDVGDPAVLREAMARLSRHSAAIVWLNPLIETPGYEPIALGMRVARPFVTTFAAVGDPAGLERLAKAIRVNP